MGYTFKAIGTVRTDHQEAMPRHWSCSDVAGQIVLEASYARCLTGIAVGERIIVLFVFDRSPPFTPDHELQTPPHREHRTGVLSTCSPVRPNPIGLSVVEVTAIDGATVSVLGLDMLDGTPVLDIKPWVTGPARDAGEQS
jgi:tRNA-Thr(GGU) m(6)t(6)A37 methyltransferase TsaA